MKTTTMENQTKDKDENLFERDTTNDFSSGPLTGESSDAEDEDLKDEDAAEKESAADDEMEEDL